MKFTDETIRRIFGSEDAESEDPERFKEYFVRNGAFTDLKAELPLRIVVGHKGVGKSALLRRAYEQDIENGQLAVFIQPADIASLLKDSSTVDINQKIEAWKAAIELVIARKAIDYFTDQRDKIDLSVIGVGKSVVAILQTVADSIASHIADPVRKAVFNRFLSSKQIYVYIDDIDRGWSASAADILNISALINALRDIVNRDRRTRCRLAIRTDVYFLVRTSDESTDKIEQDIIRLSWTNDEILRLIAKRVSTFFNLQFSDDQIHRMNQKDINDRILLRVITPMFEGRGKWRRVPTHRVLMSLCRSRPRDLIKLLHAAARQAARGDNFPITSTDLTRAFQGYSEERLQDLFNEFKSEMPVIESFVLQFRPTKIQRQAATNFVYTTDQLITKIKAAKQSVPVRFASGRMATDKSLLTFLYKIDFFIARVASGDDVEWKYFDQSRFLAHESADFGNAWEIHPAYRWALQPNDIQSVIDTVSIA